MSLLDVPAVKSVFRILLMFSDDVNDPITATANMISEWVQEEYQEQVSEDEASRILEWASRLGIVCIEENGYRLDTAYVIGLKAIFE